MEMEKLTRPLVYEKNRESIYSPYYEDEENILGFIVNEE